MDRKTYTPAVQLNTNRNIHTIGNSRLEIENYFTRYSSAHFSRINSTRYLSHNYIKDYESWGWRLSDCFDDRSHTFYDYKPYGARSDGSDTHAFSKVRDYATHHHCVL